MASKVAHVSESAQCCFLCIKVSHKTSSYLKRQEITGGATKPDCRET